MTSSSEGVPPVLSHLVRRVKALHETVVLVTLVTERVPVVLGGERMSTESLGAGFYRVVVKVGFMETPDVPRELAKAVEKGVPLNAGQVTYFVGRETFLASPKGKMGAVSESIFALLSRNARTATLYFNIPTEQVLEAGMQIDL